MLGRVRDKKREKREEKKEKREVSYALASFFLFEFRGADLKRRGVKGWGNGKWRGRRVVLRRVVVQHSGGWVGGVKSGAVGGRKNSPGWEN